MREWKKQTVRRNGAVTGDQCNLKTALADDSSQRGVNDTAFLYLVTTSWTEVFEGTEGNSKEWLKCRRKWDVLKVSYFTDESASCYYGKTNPYAPYETTHNSQYLVAEELMGSMLVWEETKGRCAYRRERYHKENGYRDYPSKLESEGKVSAMVWRDWDRHTCVSGQLLVEFYVRFGHDRIWRGRPKRRRGLEQYK